VPKPRRRGEVAGENGQLREAAEVIRTSPARTPARHTPRDTTIRDNRTHRVRRHWIRQQIPARPVPAARDAEQRHGRWNTGSPAAPIAR